MPTLTGITNKITQSLENFTTTLAQPATYGATTITLSSFSNATSTYTNGSFICLTLDPGTSIQNVVYGIVALSTFTLTNCIWTEGNTNNHVSGATVEELTTATHWDLLSSALLSQLSETGAILPASVTNAMLAGGITGANIATNTITSSNIVNNTLGTSQIAGGGILNANIAAGTLTGSSIAANTITGNNLVGINLFGVGSAVSGAPPARLSGQFYIQAGTSVIAFNASSSGNLSFPVAFPNGVIAVIPSSGDSGNPLSFDCVNSTITTSSIQLICYNGSAGAGAIGARVNWIAIGF